MNEQRRETLAPEPILGHATRRASCSAKSSKPTAASHFRRPAFTRQKRYKRSIVRSGPTRRTSARSQRTKLIYHLLSSPAGAPGGDSLAKRHSTVGASGRGGKDIDLTSRTLTVNGLFIEGVNVAFGKHRRTAPASRPRRNIRPNASAAPSTDLTGGPQQWGAVPGKIGPSRLERRTAQAIESLRRAGPRQLSRRSLGRPSAAPGVSIRPLPLALLEEPDRCAFRRYDAATSDARWQRP
jgi:hypothetical protein